MKLREEAYKHFEGKVVIIKTNSNFTFHTDNLKVIEKGVLFLDKYGQEIMLSFDEIKVIQEVKNES